MNRVHGGGHCGDLVRAFDWSATSLGAMPGWPPSLRTSVEIVLNSPVAMVLLWGPDHVMVYNDRYAAIDGMRHPGALGRAVPAIWPEGWDWDRAVLAACLRGQVMTGTATRMALQRPGRPEPAWFDVYYSAVRNEAQAAVAGVLCTVLEAAKSDGAAAWAPNRRLSDKSEFLRDLFERAPNFMAVLRGPEHAFEVANAPFLQLVGQRAVLGRRIVDALPELQTQPFIGLLNQVYRSGEPFVGKQMKVQLRNTPNGELDTRYVDFVYQPIRDRDGKATGIFVQGSDVTERRGTAELLRIAQEAGRIGSFEWFPASGKMVVSATFRRIWGLSERQEVSAALLVSLVDEQDRDLVATAQLAQEGNPLAYVEYRIRRPDNGQLRWIARRGEVVRADDPAAARYVGVCFDITERKHTEYALRASQDRLAAIFGQASVGLAEIDLDGRYRRVNGALCGMLGRSNEQLQGLSIDQIIHPDDLAEHRALFERVVRTGQAFTLEKRYGTPAGGYIWVASSMSLLVDERGRPKAVIAVKTDITEKRRAAATLRELNETLEQRVALALAQRDEAENTLRQAQKMDAVGQLTGGVAHDFNNVLQIISGNLQLMQQHHAEQPRRRRSADAVATKRVDTAISAVKRGAKLSSQLLAFARSQPLQPLVTNLGGLVGNIDGLLRRTLGEAIEIKTTICAGLWNTLIDPGQLENVIVNLAINARHAMDGEGTLTIELGNAILSQSDVLNLADVDAGQYVMLAVGDTGCGMSELVLERAFEPFFTTKPEGEGTGLGLSMAYGFVKQSRGHIAIFSEPGQGTSIKIYLPRSLQAEADESAVLNGPVVGGAETILVVEDDAEVRITVVDMLGELGYHVLKAGHGHGALAILRSGVPVDVLFTDVVMPGPVRSPDLARQARKIRPDIGVLFTSGYPRDAIVHGGRLDPGVELLSKPYRREDLARKLRHLLANRQHSQQARQPVPEQAQVQAPERAPQPSQQQVQQQFGQPAGEPGCESAREPVDVKHGTPPAAPGADDGKAKLHVLVVEDNPDSNEIVCELIAMLGHDVSNVLNAEQAWNLMQAQDFDVLLTDVSLPGMSGIELARKVLGEKPHTRIIFSTGHELETIAKIGIKADILRKPYDLLQLKALLVSDANACG
jgi:PAS domain S-box-containing protein